VLGAFIATSSLGEAHALWTVDRTRELTAHYADELVRRLTGNAVPGGAQQSADALRDAFVERALARRALCEALEVTDGLLGGLLAVTAAAALQRRTWGRRWLAQAAFVAIGFAVAQTAAEGLLKTEQARILAQYGPAILGALDPAPAGVIGALGSGGLLRGFVLTTTLLGGGLKIAFFGYLLAVLRRPTVEALFR
jgi:hypothetical protein